MKDDGLTDRAKLQYLLLIFLVLLFGGYYIYNVCPHLPWLDSGELISTSFTLGTPHPPGSALYAVVGKFFSYFLPGNVAYRYNVLSLIFSVVCILLIWRVCTEVVDFVFGGERWWLNEVCGAIISAMVGFMPQFMIQAVRAEVYSLGFCIEVAILWVALRVVMNGSKNFPPGGGVERAISSMFFFWGFGLSVHSAVVILMLPVCLFVTLWWIFSSEVNVKRVVLIGARSFVFFLASLSPMFYLIVRSLNHPYLDFSHVDCAGSFFEVFSGAVYSGSFSLKQIGSIEHLRNFVSVFIRGSSMFYLVFSAVGIMVLVMSRRALLFVILLTVVFGSAGLFLQERIYSSNPDSFAYVFPALFSLVVVSCVGLRSCSQIALLKRVISSRRVFVSGISIAIGMMLWLSQLLHGLAMAELRDSFGASIHANLLDYIIPPDSIVFVNNDEVSFPLIWLQACEGRRLDITVATNLSFQTESAYRGFRRRWPDRMPRLDKIDRYFFPSVYTEKKRVKQMGRLLDAIVNYNVASRPIVWDYLDGRTIKMENLKRYFHMGLIVVNGESGAVASHKVTGGGEESARIFDGFFKKIRLPEADSFAFSRLARSPLAISAEMHLRAGDFKSALIFYTIALGFSPCDVDLLVGRGRVFEMAGRSGDALSDYRRAYKCNPGDSKAASAIKSIREKF